MSSSFRLFVARDNINLILALRLLEILNLNKIYPFVYFKLRIIYLNIIKIWGVHYFLVHLVRNFLYVIYSSQIHGRWIYQIKLKYCFMKALIITHTRMRPFWIKTHHTYFSISFTVYRALMDSSDSCTWKHIKITKHITSCFKSVTTNETPKMISYFPMTLSHCRYSAPTSLLWYITERISASICLVYTL